MEKSFGYFRKAIELDPNFAEAYVELAAAESTSVLPSPEAEALIEKALQLDNASAEAHATYGFIRLFHHFDWVTAERELDRAIELNPNSVTAHHWKGVYLSLRGRLDEAKAEMHRALDLDPHAGDPLLQGYESQRSDPPLERLASQALHVQPLVSLNIVL